MKKKQKIVNDTTLEDGPSLVDAIEQALKDFHTGCGGTYQLQSDVRRALTIYDNQTKNKKWTWICELCYKKCYLNVLPNNWLFCFQSAVCPSCQSKAHKDGLAIADCKGGQYAKGEPDPRGQIQGINA